MYTIITIYHFECSYRYYHYKSKTFEPYDGHINTFIDDDMLKDTLEYFNHYNEKKCPLFDCSPKFNP